MRGIEQFLQVDAATLGALKYAGTWNASTNTPTLASGVGVQGQYYVVSVAGSTNLDGETNWQVGDWAVFNGSVWQKVDGGSTGLLTTLTVTGNTFLATTSGDVGIGTSSPSYKLDVVGEVRANNLFRTTDGTNIGLFGSSVFATNVIGVGSSNSAPLVLGTAATERMRIDTAGALLVGLTSSTDTSAGNVQANGPLLVSGALNAHQTSKGALQYSTGEVSLRAYGATAGTGYLAFRTGGGGGSADAEAMRITSAGDVGIGTSSPGYKLTVAGTSGSAVVSLLETGVRAWGIRAGGVTTNTFDIADFTAGVSRLTLDSSGNLGLGITPSAWVANSKALQIGNFVSLWQGSNGATQLGFGVYEGGINTYNYSTTGDFPTMYRQLTGAHIWYNAPSGTAGNAISFTQAMTLDASGDFIVGGTTTNSVRLTAEKSNPTRGIIAHVLNSGSSGLTGSQLMFTQNTVNNWVVGQPAGVDAFAFWSGRNTAADGTERMRLDASGNLGLGVTPSAWSGIKALEFGGGNFIASNGGNGVWQGNNCYYNGANWIYKATAAASYSNQVLGTHAWYTAPSGTAGNAISFTQAMTLDANGRLLVGTTTAGIGDNNATALSVANGTATVYQSIRASGGEELYLYSAAGSVGLYSYTNHPLVFGTNNAERARITSGGDFHVARTTTADTTVGISLFNSGTITCARSSSSDADLNLYVYSTGAAAARFYVGMGGTVYATNTTISAISDQRFKENIRDLDVGLNAIMALKPRKFDWKTGKGKDIKDDRGFIAQEFEQVFPDLVDDWADPAPKGEDPYKSVRQDLIPVLVKAIQELKAEVDSLKTQLGA